MFHRFSHVTIKYWVFPVIFPLDQSTDLCFLQLSSVESDQEMEELCAEEGLALQGFRAQEHREICWRYAGDTVEDCEILQHQKDG